MLSSAELANLAANPNLKKTVSASGSFTGANLANVEDSYVFFKTTKEATTNSNLALSLQKGKSMEEVASTSAEKSFARLVEANPRSAIYSSMLGATHSVAAAYFSAFSNDLDFKAQNNSAIDSFMLANSVKNKNGAKRADIGAGVELWLLSSASRVTSGSNAGGRLGGDPGNLGQSPHEPDHRQAHEGGSHQHQRGQEGEVGVLAKDRLREPGGQHDSDDRARKGRVGE